MTRSMREIAKEWLPPVLRQWGRRFFGIRLCGDFPDWSAAQRECGQGYAEEAVLARVEAATRAVLDGRAAWERDGVLFSEPDPDWRLLAVLGRVHADAGRPIRVVDIGGGLASTWLRNRVWLPPREMISWQVVEQPAMVAIGRRLAMDPQVGFHDDLKEALALGYPDIILFGGVLQYLSEPFAMLATALSAEPQRILIDRTPFHSGERDLIAVQRVPKNIGRASYPSWIFSRQQFLTRLSGSYAIAADQETDDRCDRSWVSYRAVLLQRSKDPA